MQSQPVAVLVAVIVGCLVTVNWAQTPCCGPRQFQALHAVRFSPNSSHVESFSSVAYDFTRQLVASNETLIGGRFITHQRVLINGTKRTMYIVDHNSRECRIIALSRGIDPPCIPNNFRGEGTVFIGAGSDSVSINSFRGRVSDLEFQVSASKSACVPISQVAFSERFHETESFVNVTLGIRDPNVFRVPPECTRAGVRAPVRLTRQQLLAVSPMMKSLFLGGLGN